MGAGRGKQRRARSKAYDGWAKLAWQDKNWVDKRGEVKEITAMHPAYRRAAADFFVREYADYVHYTAVQQLRREITVAAHGNFNAPLAKRLEKKLQRLLRVRTAEWAETLPLVRVLRSANGKGTNKILPRVEVERVYF